MLDHVTLHDKATRVRQAIDDTLNIDNIRTSDLGGKASTSEFAKAVVSRVNAG